MSNAAAAERFSKILTKAKALGLTNEQLASLKSVKALKSKQKFEFGKYIYGTCLSFIAFVVILLAICIAGWPFTTGDILKVYFHWNNFNIEEEPCLMELRDDLVDFTRPPVDCEICRDVTEVEKVSQLSPEEFEERFAYSGRPVVVQDGTKGWSAMDTFSFEFFKSLYGEESPALYNVEESCQFFPYKTDFKSLREVFNMSQERAEMKDGSKPWYIGWSNCDSSVANILRSHYDRPYFLPALSESSRTDWLFMGSPGYGAHMHIDNVALPSWQAQITGRKLWKLEPPPECYSQCVGRIEAEVNPGEIIVLDTNRWFHSTLIISEQEMSITIGSEYN